MLVVLAIIAILFSLALPSISRSSRASTGAACLSQIRQLTLAIHLYTADQNETIPLNQDGLASHLEPNWVAGNMRIKEEARNTALMLDTTRSLLAAYVRSPELYKCPADESLFVRSVSMNCRMNPQRAGGPPRWLASRHLSSRVFRKTSDVVEPANTFTLLDESSALINDGYFAVDLSNTGSPDGHGRSWRLELIDRPAARHDGAASISFFDGHVERHRWQDPAVFAAEDIAYLQRVCSP